MEYFPVLIIGGEAVDNNRDGKGQDEDTKKGTHSTSELEL